MTPKKLIALGAALLALAAGGGATLASFAATTSNSGNSFGAAASFNAMRVQTGTYTGLGIDNTNIAVPFQPDVVIVKANTAQAAVFRTSTAPGDLSKQMTGATMVAANLIQALTATGFQVGTDNRVNQLGTTYHWVAFRNAPGQLAGGIYTGNGAASQAVTGLGFSPDYVLVGGAATAVVQRSSSMTTTLRYDEIAAAANGITGLNSDGFTVGNSAETNTNGQGYGYVAWNEVNGLIHEESYAGDNTDNRSITGATFAPAYAFVKSGSSGNICDRGMQRPSTLGGDNTQYFNNIANANDSIQALQADGLQLGTACRVNANGTTYHWMAFRQN